jgi:hypothetical protein
MPYVDLEVPFHEGISRRLWAHAGMRSARSGVRRMERIHSSSSNGCRNQSLRLNQLRGWLAI